MSVMVETHIALCSGDAFGTFGGILPVGPGHTEIDDIELSFGVCVLWPEHDVSGTDVAVNDVMRVYVAYGFDLALTLNWVTTMKYRRARTN